MANRDITSLIADYREAARHLWHCHYLPGVNRENAWDVRDSFDTVAIALFESLVLQPLGMDGVKLAPASAHEPTPMRGIFVASAIPDGRPIMINRTSPRSGYWDHPKKQLRADEAELLLARFFDWDQLGYRDFRYLEVFIASAPAEPELVGRWALLEFQYARVFVIDPTV